MLSKRQAEAASEALLESARQRSDKASPVLARFPELADVPYPERAPLLETARKAAWYMWPLQVTVGCAVALAIFWIWAVFMKPELAGATWWIPFLFAVFAQRVSHRQVRRALRLAIARQSSKAS